jgi:hypothetical protein
MRDQQSVVSSETHTSGFFNQIHRVVTAKRVGYSLAGAFAFAGVTAAAANVGTNAKLAPTPPQVSGTQSATTPDEQAAAATPEPANATEVPTQNSTSTSTGFTANTTPSGEQTVQLQVNGQDVPVPTNGSSQQIVTNVDGTQTSVSTSTTQQGDNSNQSFTSVNLNVHSHSSSFTSGGTTSTP